MCHKIQIHQIKTTTTAGEALNASPVFLCAADSFKSPRKRRKTQVTLLTSKSMKTIDPNKINLSDASRISSKQSPRQLLRVGEHTYAIIQMDRTTKPLLAFESEDLSKLLRTINSLIVDVALIENLKKTEFTLRLYLLSGGRISMKSSGCIQRDHVTAPGHETEPSLKIPTEVWKLPDEVPFNIMRVSEALAAEISVNKATHPIELSLSLIWSIYEAFRSDPDFKVGVQFRVNAGRCRFTMVKYDCNSVSCFAFTEQISTEFNPKK